MDSRGRRAKFCAEIVLFEKYLRRIDASGAMRLRFRWIARNSISEFVRDRR